MDINSNSLSSALLQSMDSFAKAASRTSEGTLTVEAEIVEIIDKGTGVYKVHYLGNYFEATASHIDIEYELGDLVYVIIPNGDFNKNKIILSHVNAEGIKYTDSTDENSYIPMGDNLFASVSNVELSTYKPERKNVTASTNGFNQLIVSALKDSRTFNLTCRIKTNIEKTRRIKGNYGLVLTIPVIQEDTHKHYNVTLDISNLKGDPYNYAEYALQNLYFTLPADMEYDTSANPSLSSFVENFIGENTKYPIDIWIKDIKLLPIAVVGGESKTGYYLSLSASEGNCFLPSRFQSIKSITPTVYLNGNVTKVENFECYWFKENCLVDNEDSRFNRLGGLGWEILNDKTSVSINDDGRETYQYITNVYSQEVKQNELHYATRYKCVLVKNDKVISQIITIRNLSALADIQLVTSIGSNVYAEGIGRARLIMRYYEADITDTTLPAVNVNYAWQRYDKLGSYIDNNFFTIDRINEKVDINGKIYFETEISYDVSEIDISNTIYCTVYLETNNNGQIQQSIVGTTSIVLSTTTQVQPFIFKVENGDKLYKYDTDGDSPRVADYDGPLSSAIKTIPPIRVSLFKTEGTEFTLDEYALTELEWLVPVNSMITISNDLKTDLVSNEGYYTIKGKYNEINELAYDIANTYNKNKSDNTILIRAYLKNCKAENAINIRFLKDGEAGTNGSKYSAVITYNGLGYGELDQFGKTNKIQLIYAADKGRWYAYKDNKLSSAIDAGAIFAKLGIDLYCDGEKITSPEVASWKIFDLANTTDQIKTPITIDTKGNLSLKGESWVNVSDVYSATIEACVRAKRNAETDESDTGSEEYIYAYYPIETTWVQSYNYLKKLVPSIKGGFSTVEYSSDGGSPKYDSSSDFEFVDSDNGNFKDLYNYNWSYSQNLYLKNNKVTPTSKFDNGISKNYVKAILSKVDNAESIVNERLAGWRAARTTAVENLSYYQSLESSLDILKISWYNDYVGKIEKASKVYKIKSELFNICTDLYDTLTNLQNLTQQYENEDAGIASLASTVDSRISTISTLISFVGQLAVKSNAVSNVKSITPNSLLLSSVTQTNNSPVILLTINDSILRYNNKVNKIYTTYYNQLDNNFVKLQQNVLDVINGLQSYINNVKWNDLTLSKSEGYLYIPLHNNLQVYINCFSLYTNAQDIINNILKPMKKAIDSLSNINYVEEINKLQENINYFNSNIAEYENLVLPTGNTGIIHIKPIVMYYNRYEMSNINGWDGNKLQVDDGYLLAPQVGAGKKENGLFTGIVMGIKNPNNKSIGEQKIGLLGFESGIQTIFLNARTGSAEFGKSGKGQIIIDPRNDKAIIKSGNYKEKTKTQAGEGMQIDLTTPEIRWGNGNFFVTSEGYMHAGGAPEEGTTGDIGGWYIGNSSLYSGNYKNTKNGILLDAGNDVISLGSDNGKIYSGAHNDFDSNAKGFYLGNDGFSICDTDKKNYIGLRTTGTPTIYTSGHTSLDSNSKGFYLSSNGFSISSGGKGGRLEFNTEDSSPKIYSNNHSTLASISNGFYLGGDGLSIGSKVRIDSEGKLRLGLGAVSSGTNCWEINGAGNGDNESRSYIANGGMTKFHSNDPESDTYSEENKGVYIGTDGIVLGKNFSVSRSGELFANSGRFKGDITGSTGTFSGKITANKGSIGGWNIDEDSLNCKTEDNFTMRISSKNGINFNNGIFKVDKNGKLTATDAYIKGEIHADSGSFKGAITATSGIFHGRIEATEGYFIGEIKANAGYFKGDITGSTGTFSGKIEAKTGKIGGWIIEKDCIKSYNDITYLNSDGSIGSSKSIPQEFLNNSAYGETQSSISGGSSSPVGVNPLIKWGINEQGQATFKGLIVSNLKLGASAFKYIQGIKVSNAGYADSAGSATTATNLSGGTVTVTSFKNIKMSNGTDLIAYLDYHYQKKS